MEDRDLFYASEYHHRLVTVSQQERNIKQAKVGHPGVRDYMLLQMGGYLIALGHKLRSASTYPYEKPVELAQDCL